MVHAFWGRAHMIVVHTAEAPSDDEWNAYIQDLERTISEVTGTIVITSGGGPNSSQRRAVNALMAREGRKQYRGAVVTESLLVRGIVKALSLFNPGIRVFRPDALDPALAHVGLAL